MEFKYEKRKKLPEIYSLIYRDEDIYNEAKPPIEPE